MPELVVCPSCGCKVQLAELFLGQYTRCFACSHRFVATLDRTPSENSSVAPTVPFQNEAVSRVPMPLCPGCHRPVSWEVLSCPLCGLLLDPQDVNGSGEWPRRRDAVPHRGPLIDTLGSCSLLAGVLSVCIAPLSFPVALATGIPTLVMAHHDLKQMRIGAVDSGGRHTSEVGQIKAIAGVSLAIVFTVLFCIVGSG